MKWKNKGHEFDEIGAVFQKNSEILIVGNEEETEKIYKKLEFLNTKVTCFTDIELFDLGHGLKKRIKQIKTKFVQNIFKNKTIVLANSIAYNNRLIKILNKLKLKEKINYFREEEFFNKFLSIYAVYVSDKVYFPSNSFICTTVCTLNCRDCLNFAPYDKHKTHYDLERLKSDVDTYFKCVDRVGLFHISGGEPFSYPHLKELIEYIHNNYKNQIETLAVVTNMTILPSDELCQTLKETQILVQLDDYRNTNEDKRQQYEKVLAKLKNFNVNLDEIVAGTLWNWVSAFPPKKVTTDETELIRKYQICGSIFQELKEQKILGCSYCGFIAQAGVFDYQKDDYYDLSTYTPEHKKELVEFRMKFNTKGYVAFCKFCNGLPPYNSDYIQPAIQAKGYLEWDINNPTEVKEVVNTNK